MKLFKCLTFIKEKKGYYTFVRRGEGGAAGGGGARRARVGGRGAALAVARGGRKDAGRGCGGDAVSKLLI